MTRTTKKPPFAEGDRVRAYHGTMIVDGTVTRISTNGTIIEVKLRDGTLCDFHPKQLRRIKPPKAPREAREWWILTTPNDQFPVACTDKWEADKYKAEDNRKDLCVIHVREVLPSPKGKEPARGDE